MLFSTATILASCFASMAIANPIQAEAIATPAHLDSREEDWGKVLSFSGDLCNGVSSTLEVLGSGSFRCIAIGGGSIQDVQKRYVHYSVPERYQVTNKSRGCTIKTWSGADCHGSSWTMPDADFGCHSVLHAAVSISC